MRAELRSPFIFFLLTFIIGAGADAKQQASGMRALVSKAGKKLECEMKGVVHNVANISSALNEGLNSALGFSDQCWRDENGTSVIRCEDVQEADQQGFISHYDYAPDPMGLSPNHRTCTVPEAASILEDLMVSDLAKAVEDSVGCQLPFLNELIDNPTTPQIQEFQNKAFAAYEKIVPQLSKLIPERDRLQHDADFGSSVCRGPAKEGHDPQLSLACKTYRSDAGQAGVKRAQELTTEIDLLVNSVPMGVDPNVHDAVVKLAKSGVSTKDSFFAGYRKPLQQVREDSTNVKSLLERARLNDGNQYFIEPVLRAQLLGISNYKAFVNSKTKLKPKVRNVLNCLHDAREKGAKRALFINFGGAAVSAAATMGASLGGIALGEGATALLIGLDLGVSAIGSIQTSDAIYSRCYGEIQSFAPGGQCSIEQGMNVAVGRATRASCAAEIVPTIAPVAIAGVSAVAKTVLKEAPSISSAALRTERRIPPRGRRESDLAARTSGPREGNRTEIQGTKGVAERLNPQKARARKKQDLIDALERKTFSTPKESRDYVAAALDVKPEDGALFFYEENSALKSMNEMYKDQRFVTAVTNLRLHFLNQRLKQAGFHMPVPGAKTIKNGDYKSLAKAWLDELNTKDLDRLKQARELAKRDYIEELQRLHIVRKEDNLAENFRAGTGRTADEAAAAARAARALPDTGVRDYNDPEIIAIMNDNLKQAHETRKAVAERPAVQFLLEKTEDGDLVPTREAFGLMRKNSSPEELLAAITTRYPQSHLTLDDARDLAAVNKAVDNFNPHLLNDTRKVASLKQAKFGGASGDFCGMGAANNHATACAIASAANRDAAIVQARQGERKITDEFKRKFEKWKEIMGGADCSGDDCVSAAQGRPWTREEKQERLNRLNENPLTRDMRVGFTSGKVKPNDIDKITYHAESIEQRMRVRLAESGFPFQRSQDITFAVDIDAQKAGQGAATWLAGVQGRALTAQEKAAIDEAFAKAVNDVNESLKKHGPKGMYHPGK